MTSIEEEELGEKGSWMEVFQRKSWRNISGEGFRLNKNMHDDLSVSKKNKTRLYT
jgi:hypothetical protein